VVDDDQDVTVFQCEKDFMERVLSLGIDERLTIEDIEKQSRYKIMISYLTALYMTIIIGCLQIL